jgi:hypothetical protein
VAVSPSPACPRCGYDLSGIVPTWLERCPLEGICSECGLPYRWRDVFDPLANVPRWSIEHAPRWVIFRLPGACMRSLLTPWLWLRLRMSHPIQMGRLVTLGALALLVPHVISASCAAWMCLRMREWGTFLGMDMHVLPPGSAFLWPYRRLCFDQYDPIVAPTLGAVIALHITFPLAFLLLPQTFAALKIRRAHLGRIWVYSLVTVVLWFPATAVFRGVGVLGALRLVPGQPFRRATGSFRLVSWLDRAGDVAMASTLWIALGVALWLGFYWWGAARFYLKVPAPLGAVLGVGAVAALAAFTLAAVWPGSTLLQDAGNALLGYRP